MRTFDWERLLNEQRIEYVTRGPNVKRGEINIRCPFCGSADPSHHMGLNLDSGWWSCWRRKDIHSGKSPLRLIMRLLNVGYGQARDIAGLGDDYVDPEGFDAVAARILNKNPTERPSATERRFLAMDPKFMPLTDRLRTRRHWNYLYSRGFDQRQKGREEVDLLVEQYGLMAGVDGKWADRVIIPFYLDKHLVTWTGRAIGPATIRYRDLDLEKKPWMTDQDPVSILGPKETLYNADAIPAGGRVLVLQEGPFDVLKVDFFGKRYGVRSVGMATNSMSEQQAYMLKEAESKFDRLIVMMDTKSQLGVVDSLRMQQKLSFIQALSIEAVPFGAGDGGALTGAEVIQWSSKL